MADTVVVAIPARNEADWIRHCLAALNRQIKAPDVVLLMLNNCTDGTEAIARTMAPGLRYRLDVVSRDLPLLQANAGNARRLAMALAAEQAGHNGVLLTTDADSQAPSDWVVRNLQALRRGADVVCGRAVIDPTEAKLIPAHLHADDALECQLIALLDAIAWALDPEPHDPPPRHTEASGASLAVRAEAFRLVGGIPAIAAGEDRAFVRALWMMDAQVRHDPAIQVAVSGRVAGRAEGGMADTILRRMVRQDEFTDNQVEPAQDAFQRYSLRYRARCAWGGAADATLAQDMGLSCEALANCLKHRFLGAAWAAVEACAPILVRRCVRFVDLTAEIAGAEALLRQLALPGRMAAD